MKSSFYFLTILFLSLFLGCESTDIANNTQQNGLISAASPEAAEAGRRILDAGGNAIDAAVATAFTLGVTEPAMSGLGGGTQVLLSIPGEAPVSINGTTFSPANTPIDATDDNLTYHKRSTIPSTVKVLDYIWRKYGSGKISWAQLLQPAIEYAEEGFKVGPFRHMVYKKYEARLKRSPHNTQYFLMPNGNIPGPGDVLKQPVLANTLRGLAKKGGDEFYKGEMAEQIAADIQSNGGWISLDDLNNFPEPVELEPLTINYGDYQVYSQPPPCGGWTTLLIMQLLQEQGYQKNTFSDSTLHFHLISALQLAQADRQEAPVTDLFDYESEVAVKLTKEYAQSLLKRKSSWQKALTKEKESGETTHFSVVDGQGIAVSVTASINAYFGSRSATKGLGFLYNSYMDDFVTEQPDHPFAIKPGAMAYSSMSPTIVKKEGQNVLVLGSPGSRRIISTVAQLAAAWMSGHGSFPDLVNAPRVHARSNRIYLEDNDIPFGWKQKIINPKWVIAYPTYDLTQNGRNAYFGGVHGMAFEKGQWVGAADPRRDGAIK
ncbi:MAG: gamma-glutamyltransferase [Bacteroidota bacterium]